MEVSKSEAKKVITPSSQEISIPEREGTEEREAVAWMTRVRAALSSDLAILICMVTPLLLKIYSNHNHKPCGRVENIFLPSISVLFFSKKDVDNIPVLSTVSTELRKMLKNKDFFSSL
jgi:hypothetical protein